MSSGPYVVTVSRFRRITRCPRGGARTLLHACIRRYSGTRFVFTNSRHRLVNRVFVDPTHPFCRDMSVLRLSTVSGRGCVRFMRRRFEVTRGGVSVAIFSSLCGHFRKVA